VEKAKLNRTDLLAIDRTRLANERTFLAYFRTFIVLLSSGVAILKLSILKEIQELGFILLGLSPLLLLIGIARFYYVKRRLKKYYYHDGNDAFEG
jgi:putative membrane protein